MVVLPWAGQVDGNKPEMNTNDQQENKKPTRAPVLLVSEGAAQQSHGFSRARGAFQKRVLLILEGQQQLAHEDPL